MNEPSDSDTPPGLRAGSRFGHYRLGRLLGEGGFGQVWEAEDTVMDRAVALKLLRSEYSGNEKFRQRLFREARAAGRLHEPHVVPIHHCGEIGGQLYIDMRLIDGTDLETVLAQEGPLSPARTVAVVRQIAAALDAAHAAEMIHRDVKPANILLAEDDFACLLDFGLANAATDAKLTSTGTTIGTFAYMSPERLSTGEVDHRADIYALACVLYECLTGSPPYTMADRAALITAHLMAPIPQPSHHGSGILAGFDDVISRGMAKHAADRYASAGELARAAQDALTKPIPVSAVDANPAVVKSTLVGDSTPAPPAPREPEPAQPIASPTLDDRSPTSPQPTLVDDATSTTAASQPPVLPNGIVHHPTPLASTEPTPPQPPPQPPLWPPASGASRPPAPPSWAPPQQPPRPAPTRRGRTPWIIAGAAAVVVLIAAAVAIPVIVGHHKSQSRQIVLPFTGLSDPIGVAVDTASNVYITDYHNNRVLKLPAGSNTPVKLPFTGLTHPSGVAVDTASNVYITDENNSRVLELPAGSDSQVKLPFPDLIGPEGVAVDLSGYVYVADANTNRVLLLPEGSNTQIVLPFTGLHGPQGVAVDTASNVYVADYNNNRVLKLPLPAGSNTQAELPFTGLHSPWGVAVDTASNVYITDENNNRVLKLPAGSNTQAELPFTGLIGPEGVAVDTAGNVYVADSRNNRVLKLLSG